MIADIVIIAVMLLCVFLGYKRGLIHVAVRIVGFILATVIALLLYTPISDYIINNTDAVSSLKTTIQSKFYNEDEKQNQEVNTQETSFIESIERYVVDKTDEVKATSSEFASEQIAIAVVRGLTWIGLFIAVRIVLIFIKALAKLIEKIPIIKQFNKARRNNIWYFRRICSDICCTCNNKLNCAYGTRK